MTRGKDRASAPRVLHGVAPRRRTRVRAVAFTLLGFITHALVSSAEPPADTSARAADHAAREEARFRFDRGLTLYDAADFRGALAEFRRAYELTQHPLVLYNLALVQAKLGLSADAVSSFEQLAPALNELGVERAERARRVYAEALLDVGTLEITSNVPGATLEVDNAELDRGKNGAVRVTAGNHVVSVWAQGYEPRRLSVVVAGNTRQLVEAELVPLSTAAGRLVIESRLLDVEVREGGQVLAKLPLSSPLTLAPGVHRLDFSRSGYFPAEEAVTVSSGEVGKLAVALAPSPNGLAAGASLRIEVSEAGAVVFVDGEPRLAGSSLRLPPGRHTLIVKHAGFFDVTREIDLAPGTARLAVTLLPTPPHLADYEASAHRWRTASYVTAGAGALVALAGGGYLIYNAGQKREAERKFDDFADSVSQSPGGHCMDDTCAKTLEILLEDANATRQRDAYGWIAVGVGGTAFVTGALLFFLGADPHRYEPAERSDVFGSLDLGVTPRSLVLHGRF